MSFNVSFIVFLVNNDGGLAIFQYKIIHHILPTGSTLFRVKSSNTIKDTYAAKEKC